MIKSVYLLEISEMRAHVFFTWVTLGLWIISTFYLIYMASWTKKTAKGRSASWLILFFKQTSLLVPLYWPWPLNWWVGKALYQHSLFINLFGTLLCATGLAL